MVVGAVLQAACQNLGTFMGGRFLLGFGNSLAQLCSPMLLTELAHPQHRGRLTTVYNCLWNVGALIVAWVSFGTNYMESDWSWRIPALIQAFPSVIQLLFIFWVPESPRYLMAKDKHDRALAILAKYHANGDEYNATVQFEFREIKETLRLEFEASKSSSYLDFFKTKGNRYRLAVLISLGVFSQWSGNAIISNYSSTLYDTAGVTGSTQKLGLSAGQTGLSLIISVTMALLVDKVGRRPMFLTATAGMFFTFIFWTLTSGLYEERNANGAGYAMIFFIWVHGIFYAISWSGLLVGYAIEILPYKLRAKGLMIMNLLVQAALTLNTYANPLAFEAFEGHAWRLYIIYTVSFALAQRALLERDDMTNRTLFVGLVTLRVDLRLEDVHRDQGPHPRGACQDHRRRRSRRGSGRHPRGREGDAHQRGEVCLSGRLIPRRCCSLPVGGHGLGCYDNGFLRGFSDVLW